MRLPFLRAKVSPDEPAPRPRRGGAGVDGIDSAVQQARTRARRRLVGALVLLTAGVLGFPILFETQPRPLPVDTPIFVPANAGTAPAGRAGSAPEVRPLPALPADAGNEPVAAVAPAAVPAPLPDVPSIARSASAPDVPPVAKSVPAPAKAAELPTAKPAVKPAVKPPAPVPAATPSAGLPPATEAAASGRFVVQVGAYNEVERMNAARQKLEKMGYKTYTQDVQTPSGKRTRVRVGPFSSRPEAEAVASKVKASGMQANILAL